MRPADDGILSLDDETAGARTAPVTTQLEVAVADALSFEPEEPHPFARTPMTVPEITALRGIVGYAPPGQTNPWLTLRLADGAWVRVAPAESDLEFYLIEPADDIAARRGVQPQFLALWAAYRSLGRMALAAMERAANAGITGSTCPIAGLDVIEVVAQDYTLPAIKLLAELAAAGNAQAGKVSTLSLAGNLAGAAY